MAAPIDPGGAEGRIQFSEHEQLLVGLHNLYRVRVFNDEPWNAERLAGQARFGLLWSWKPPTNTVETIITTNPPPAK